MGRLEGKVAFVTGAARGQGRSHAILLAEEGADIIAVDYCRDIASLPYPLASPDDLDQTRKGVEALDRCIVTVQADVRDGAALEAALEQGVAEFGRLDVVVANAGIFSIGATTELSPQTWQDVIDVNLTGVWNTARAAIPHLIAGGRGGSIVLISSAAGLKGVANLGHYVAAKHGVVGLMRTLALELAEHSIRVNTVNPTNVDTDMIQHAAIYRLFDPDSPTPSRASFKRASSELQALPIPWVDPSDIANAVAFLASEEGRYITGVALPVDAGLLVK